MKIRNPITPLRVVTRRQTYVPHILFILLLWSLAMTMDYHDQAAEAEASAQSMSSQMAECLNGTWRGIAEDGTQIGCMKAVTNDPNWRKVK